MSNSNKANQLYEDGLAAFRAGDNALCISLTQQSLQIAQQLNDDLLVGQALTGLCRAALRNQDEDFLRSLSLELTALAQRTADSWWLVVNAHMNAEMARMLRDFSRANELYDQSLHLSELLGRDSMVAAECFNKSFVAVAQGDLTEAHRLLVRHFTIRQDLDDGDLNPYGLIGVANLLRAQGEFENAVEVAFLARKLLLRQGIVPDPADERPLENIEVLAHTQLSDDTRTRLQQASSNATCRQIVNRFIWAGAEQSD